jgi:hypothetical protein
LPWDFKDEVRYRYSPDMALELVPLCSVDVTLADPVLVGEGPSGMRVIVEVADMTVSGERIRGKMKGTAAADWLTLVGGIGTLDVRATMETDDGALIYCQYRGRADFRGGPGTAPLYVAPLFETSDERYQWVNLVQGAGVGTLNGNDLHYDWYELR